MTKLMNAATAFVMGLILGASSAFASGGGFFPVDTGTGTNITNLSIDLLAWAAALLVIVLTMYAWRKVKGIVR